MGEGLSSDARDAERNRQLLDFATGLGVDTVQLAPEQVSGALARELDARGEPFLWIVDDLPGELDSAQLERWLAPGRLGRTLVTTRSHDYGAVGAQIDLGVLSAQEGFELLAGHRPPVGGEDQQAARGLVEDLVAPAPGGQTITLSLGQMSSIAKDHRGSGDPALAYKNDDLHVLDPFLLFYLRYGNWSVEKEINDDESDQEPLPASESA